MILRRGFGLILLLIAAGTVLAQSTDEACAVEGARPSERGCALSFQLSVDIAYPEWVHESETATSVVTTYLLAEQAEFVTASYAEDGLAYSFTVHDEWYLEVTYRE
ncbi:MAG: hypothetical protein AAF125_23085, partial [Chloroflexota bacterium]